MAKLKGKYITDDTIAEEKLDISNSPSDGYLLEYKDSTDKLTWVAPDTTEAHDVKVSADDTTPGYLNGKLVIVTGKTTLTENNGGGNETLSIGIGADIFDHTSDDTDDISEGDNKFVTAADITKLSNLSGTNTGDITVTDTTEIDLSLTGQQISADIKSSSIDETKLDVSVNTSLDLADTSVQNSGNETVNGIKTFGSFPISPSSAPTTDYQLSNKKYVDDIIKAADAMVYKGATDCSGTPNYPAADAGDTYKVSVAGKIGGASGVVVEVGDMFICTADSTASGDQATVGAYWDVLQVNIDGAVIGPASAVSTDLATFDGTTGKLIADSGLLLANVFDKSTDDTDDVTIGDAKFVTSSDITVLGNTSGTNSGDEVVATGAEVNTGSDNVKMVTPKAVADSKYITSDGTETLTNKTIDANGTGNAISNIDVADLANGTDGELITWSAAGVAATVGVGTTGYVLTSGGIGVAPTFQAASSDEIRIVEIITLDATDISNGYNDDLAQVPKNATVVGICPVGGIPQEYGVDFTIITDGSNIKRINWVTLGLASLLANTDKLIVSYTY